MMIMIMVIINNNKNNRLTFGSPRVTWILAAGLMLVTGFWLPIEEVLAYSHKEKSPAPWGPCGPIGPWEPLNPWGPIAPWDPLNPWGPVGPIGPWEPFTPGGPTGPGSLLTFSIWKEMHRFLFFFYVFRFPTSHRSLERWKPTRGKEQEQQKSALVTQLKATCIVASRISVVIILFAMKIGVSIFKAWLLESGKKNLIYSIIH